jgi:hypothetical protein
MATLRTAALNQLRLAGIQSSRTEMQAVMHNMTAYWRWRCVSQSASRAEIGSELRRPLNKTEIMFAYRFYLARSSFELMDELLTEAVSW